MKNKKYSIYYSVFLAFIVGLFLSACGGGGGGSKEPVTSQPKITSFTASTTTITKGRAINLIAIFSNGSGMVENERGGKIAIQSGVELPMSPVENTIYTLVITNNEGEKVSKSLSIIVNPIPVITSFTASPTTFLIGGNTTLAASFTGGHASINNGVGVITSGEDVTISPSETTTYTLTVTSKDGVQVESTIEILVSPVIGISMELGRNLFTSADKTTEISVSITSELDITSVTATLNGQSVSLTRQPNTRFPSKFSGNISLELLPSGDHIITVTAKDTQGRAASENIDIRLDNPPTLTIASPLDKTARNHEFL